MKVVKYKPTRGVFITAISLFCAYMAALIAWPQALSLDTYYILPLVAPEGLLPEDRSIITTRLRLASSILSASILLYLIFINIRMALARPLQEEVLKVGKFLRFLAIGIIAVLAVFTLGLAVSTRLSPEDLERAKSIISTITTVFIIIFMTVIVFLRPSGSKSIDKKEVRGILTSGAYSIMILAVIGILATVVYILKN